MTTNKRVSTCTVFVDNVHSVDNDLLESYVAQFLGDLSICTIFVDNVHSLSTVFVKMKELCTSIKMHPCSVLYRGSCDQPQQKKC